MKTYMIIERYKTRKTEAIYKRFSEKGRMLPEGVVFVDSWIEDNLQKCYQVMKSESPEKINEWMAHWNDLVDFEVIPVISSSEANMKTKKKDKNP